MGKETYQLADILEPDTPRSTDDSVGRHGSRWGQGGNWSSWMSGRKGIYSLLSQVTR